MAMPVKVVLWPPGGGAIAIGELRWTMYDVPDVGSRYWHGRDPLVVREIDGSTDPLTIHLEHAGNDWISELRAALPDDYWLHGGRSSDDGSWHFHLEQEGVERPIGIYVGQTLEAALAAAIAGGNERQVQQST